MTKPSTRRILTAMTALGVALALTLYAGSPRTRNTAPAQTAKIERVVVHKKLRRMELISHGSAWKSYRIALGGNPEGHKERQGDSRTPEGTYVLDRRNPHSQFHRSIHISYPNTLDLERARQKGVSPGGDIFIHGLPNGLGWIGQEHLLRDWTDGCIAVTNEEMDEIWQNVRDGTPIEILP